jgi:hypothetical protein
MYVDLILITVFVAIFLLKLFAEAAPTVNDKKIVSSTSADTISPLNGTNQT